MTKDDAPPEPAPEAPPEAPREPAEDDELIARANEAAERLEAANKELGKLLLRQETANAEAVLAGKADAGRQKKTPEEKSVESAKELLKGTGYEDLFDKHEPLKFKKE